MNNDLISRSKVIEELNYLKHIGYDNSGVMKLQNMEIQRCISVIEDVPAVEKRPQGEWIEYAFKTCGGLGDWDYKCSNCEKVYGGKYNFCPNCGADMRNKKITVYKTPVVEVAKGQPLSNSDEISKAMEKAKEKRGDKK